MKNLILAFCITALLALYAPANPACYCVIPDVPEAYKQAAAVFVGEVVEIVPPPAADEKSPPAVRFYTLKFKVEKSWKGSFASLEVPVLSAQGDGCFAYPAAQVGKKYLVYADPLVTEGGPVKDQMVVTACSRTGLIPEVVKQTGKPKSLEFNREDASPDIKALDRLALFPPRATKNSDDPPIMPATNPY